MAFDHAVTRVDAGLLIELNIFRLSLGDFYFGLQLRWVGHAGEVRSGDDALSDFERQLLQHSGKACAHL